MTDVLTRTNSPDDSDTAIAIPAGEVAAASARMGAAKVGGSRRWLDAAGLAEGGLLLDVAVIVDLAAIYLPIIGMALAPAVPAPFALLFLRRGFRVALLASVVAGFLVTVLAGPHFGWRMGLEALLGIVLGAAMKRRTPPTLVLFAGTVLLTTAGFCASLGLILLTGFPLEDIPISLRNGMVAASSLAAAVATFGGFSEAWLAIRPALADVARLALRYWPVVYYLYLAAFALPATALYYAVSNVAVRVLGYDVRPFPPRWVVVLARVALAPLWPFLWLARPRRGRRADADEDLPPRKGEAA